MLHQHASLPSTQEEAHRLAAAGAPHGTAVVARIQTAGRGTRGRPWRSPAGGLWLSVVCRPDRAAPAAGFSVRIGLAAADGLEAECPAAAPLALKWPNDLHLHGRKVAGILCEARWQGDTLGWIVAGIGVNVANAIPEELRGLAARLAEADPAITPERLAEPLARAVAAAGSRGGELSEVERRAFARRDTLRGRRLVRPLAGIADGIEANGALRIRQNDGATALVTDAGVEAARD